MWRFLLSLLLITSLAHGQTFNDFLRRVNIAPAAERPAIVDSLMNAIPSFPFIEGKTLVHFIYRGNASGVTVPGDANGWDGAAFPMAKIGGTDFWYVTKVFESDARLDYKFVLNGSNWILDPRNPNTVRGGFGPNSELRMPDYVMPPEIAFYSDIPHGTLRDTVFFSQNLGNSRTVRVYLPPGYDQSNLSYPLALFHDGLDYINLANANNVLDYLISQNEIKPLIAVFVPPVSRNAEYAGSLQGAFTKFIVNELMVWLDRRYRTSKNPADRAVIGASNGGNIALYLGLSHPEIFGNVAAQSSNVESNISSGFQNSAKLPLQIYMDLGTYDIPLLIQRVHDFVPILQSKGYPLQFQEYHEGHSWGNWRAHLDNALKMFFPAQVTKIRREGSLPREFKLFPNYPNPFNPGTTIRFSLSREGTVSVDIYNTLGQKIRVLLNRRVSPGEYSVVWDGTDERHSQQPSGIYILRLSLDGSAAQSRKMILLR